MTGTPDITIIGSTPDYVVIDKPAGMLSVPGKGPDKADCASARVRGRFPGATGNLVVHRLDMDTSGLLVFGLTSKAQRELCIQFERRTVDKRYVALVEGRVRSLEGRVELPLRADIDNRPIQIVDEKLGKPSVTGYRVLSYETDRTRVLFMPVTGRSHQIRVHAADPRGLGCPILGDVLYGDQTSAERLMLHACELSFNDPVSRRRVRFESACPF